MNGFAGLKSKNKGKRNIPVMIIIGFVTGFANGLFGSGGGTIVVPAMIFLLGMEDHKAHATAISVILPLTLLSAILYTANRYTDWDLTWKVTLGGAAGGYVGAKLLNICPAKWLRIIFAFFMIFASIRLIFFS